MTLRDEALDAIKAMILSGELAGKTSEQTILHELEKHGTGAWAMESPSRTPIREALAVLSHLGLVAQVPQRGVTILRMTPDAADQCLRLRSLVEGQVVRHLMEQRSGSRRELVAEAQQANVALRQAETIDQLMRAETRFHCALPESLRLDEHAQSVHAYSDKLHLFRTQLAEGSTALGDDSEAQALADEHDAILEAVAGGEVQAARSALDRHGERIRARLEELASVVA